MGECDFRNSTPLRCCAKDLKMIEVATKNPSTYRRDDSLLTGLVVTINGGCLRWIAPPAVRIGGAFFYSVLFVICCLTNRLNRLRHRFHCR